MQKTLFDKIWDSHVVIDNSQDEHAGDTTGPSLLYIDRHLIHEVTSPQAFAFGIGTSEVEHVLATQCIWLYKPKSFLINVKGNLRKSHTITPKDIILKIIHEIGTDGGSGTVIEYRGQAISALSMEQRMTICNMSIEGGARAGLIAPDEITFNYLRGRRYAPKESELDKMIEYWKSNLRSDSNVKFDRVETINVDELAPQVTWGTNPSMVVDITDSIPSPEEFAEGDENKRKLAIRALEYMNLEPGTQMTDVHVDRVFIGSCTNSRLEDLIEASVVIKGRKVSPKVRAMIVPGSQKVKWEAERLGLDRIFKDSGFEWRESGCSMCLGMNSDILSLGERCASTSNRNFEGRQGAGGRTHLVSPVTAAACAIEGHFIDVRDWL